MKSIKIAKTYSREARNKVLAIRVSSEEAKYVARIAHSFDYSISNLVREALENRINQLLSDEN